LINSIYDEVGWDAENAGVENAGVVKLSLWRFPHNGAG